MNSTYQRQIFQTIKSFAGEKNILAIPKSFIRFCDKDLYIGLFLSQIIYLSDKGNREDGYIYKSNKEWKEDYFLSDYAIRKSKKYLEEKGIIKTKLIKANGAPTTHYKLNTKKFTELFMKFLQNKEGASNGFVEINDSSDSIESSKSTNGFETDNPNDSLDSLNSTNGIVESNETLTEITTEINNNNNNNNKSNFQKIKNYFKKSFTTYPNSFQLEKIKEYRTNGLSEQLILKTIEHCGLGGHNQSFFFNRLSMLVEDEIYTVDQLKSVLSQSKSLKNNSSSSKKETKVKNQSNKSNYKWKDFFIDPDKYKE